MSAFTKAAALCSAPYFYDQSCQVFQPLLTYTIVDQVISMAIENLRVLFRIYEWIQPAKIYARCPREARPKRAIDTFHEYSCCCQCHLQRRLKSTISLTWRRQRCMLMDFSVRYPVELEANHFPTTWQEKEKKKGRNREKNGRPYRVMVKATVWWWKLQWKGTASSPTPLSKSVQREREIRTHIRWGGIVVTIQPCVSPTSPWRVPCGTQSSRQRRAWWNMHLWTLPWPEELVLWPPSDARLRDDKVVLRGILTPCTNSQKMIGEEETVYLKTGRHVVSENLR